MEEAMQNNIHLCQDEYYLVRLSLGKVDFVYKANLGAKGKHILC